MTSLRIGSRALCPGAAAMRLATVVASVGTSRGVYEREMKRGRGGEGDRKKHFSVSLRSLFPADAAGWSNLKVMVLPFPFAGSAGKIDNPLVQEAKCHSCLTKIIK